MADVRLTATNPEDSSVVPVACDAAGRLLLEEPVQGPPGPPGEQGPPGQNGDPFSGNFAGDVTFEGSASFGNTINLTADGTINTKVTNSGVRALMISNTDVNTDAFGGRVFQVDTSGTVSIGGSADVNPSQYKRPNVVLRADGSASFGGTNGSVTFAGNKAGFTAEGYLWCTTLRGDTVILDATSNGLASWVEYTPTTRLEEIRDKLDANRGETGEMPADTQ